MARRRDSKGRVKSKTWGGKRECRVCGERLPCTLEFFGVRAWADRDAGVVKYWKTDCRICTNWLGRVYWHEISQTRKERCYRRSRAWYARQRRLEGKRLMSAEEYYRRWGQDRPYYIETGRLDEDDIWLPIDPFAGALARIIGDQNQRWIEEDLGLSHSWINDTIHRRKKSIKLADADALLIYLDQPGLLDELYPVEEAAA